VPSIGNVGNARLVERPSPSAQVCRCGTHLGPSDRAWEVQGLAPGIDELFRERSFCSPICVRAYFLEELAVLDQLDVPAAEETVSDLREAYAGLAIALGQILGSSRPGGT
jgi:hypothetical protein